MSFLDTGFTRNNQKLCIPVDNHVNILRPKGDHRTVIENDVGEKGIRLLIRILYSCLVELELGHAKASKDHERREEGDDDGELPAEPKADQAGDGDT